MASFLVETAMVYGRRTEQRFNPDKNNPSKFLPKSEKVTVTLELRGSGDSSKITNKMLMEYFLHSKPIEL